MSIRSVDKFLRHHAFPTLAGAQFRRRRRTLLKDAPNGRQAVVVFDVEVDQAKSAFQVSYGVITPVHVEFLADQGFPRAEWPPYSISLLHSRLLSPKIAQIRAAGYPLPQQWVLGSTDHYIEIAEALARSLEDELIPAINSWFDPAMMVKDLADKAPGTYPGLTPRPRALAMALLDVEDSEELLQRTLALLPTDDMVRLWVERRRGL